MVVAPGSWTDEVWDDVNRMRTLNSDQVRNGRQMHVCPLQLDIVDRLINRYSAPGETVFDPFGGLMTVPVEAVRLGREGIGTELNADYCATAHGTRSQDACMVVHTAMCGGLRRDLAAIHQTKNCTSLTCGRW